MSRKRSGPDGRFPRALVPVPPTLPPAEVAGGEDGPAGGSAGTGDPDGPGRHGIAATAGDAGPVASAAGLSAEPGSADMVPPAPVPGPPERVPERVLERPVAAQVRAGPDPDDLYAALDLGTNSCRMLIAQPKGSQLHVVDSFSKSVQLGQGLEASGRLGRASMARAVGALKICQKKLSKHRVERARLVATEACRRATNAPEFIALVKRETGLQLEIIEPEEEARLAVVSCAPLVSTRTEQLLVVDIGGGSTELVWIDLSRVPRLQRPRAIMRLHQGFDYEETVFPRAKVVDWISIPLGVATLKDLYEDVADDGARFALMSWYFEEQLAAFSPYTDAADQTLEGFQIIGTSGTVTTVAASHLGLRRYDRNKVDGLRMTSQQIDTVINGYLALGPEGRRRDPRIGRDRQTLIMSGAAILQALLRAWPTDRLSVADRGLREGLLYAQMSRDGVLDDGPL